MNASVSDELDPPSSGDGARRINLIFALLVLLAVVGGLAIALRADTSSGDNEAWREVGGAFVAGGVLAGLVVWYEGRREARIVDRENAREDRLIAREERRATELFRAAWQRDVFLRLFALQPELETARRKWRNRHHHTYERLRRQQHGRGAPEPPSSDRTLAQVQADNDILIAFLRDPGLTKQMRCGPFSLLNATLGQDGLVRFDPTSKLTTRGKEEPTEGQSSFTGLTPTTRSVRCL